MIVRCLTASFIMLAICACGHGHHHIRPQADENFSTPELDCRAYPVSIIDNRNSDIVMAGYRESYEINDASALIGSMLTRMNPATDRPGIPLSLELIHLYGQRKSSSQIVQVVLRGHIGNGHGIVYRGQHVAMNWFGSRAEFRHAVEEALEQAFGDLSVNINRACLDS